MERASSGNDRLVEVAPGVERTEHHGARLERRRQPLPTTISVEITRKGHSARRHGCSGQGSAAARRKWQREPGPFTTEAPRLPLAWWPCMEWYLRVPCPGRTS